MAQRIVIVQGHPSLERTHLGHALANAYADAANTAGHEVRRIEIAQLEFPLLRTAEDWNKGTLPPTLREAQGAISWANHLVLLFPLWGGTMPALCKGFVEQVMRPGFAFRPRPDGPGMVPALKGKSARLVVTMGMPAFAYRWFYLAHGVRGLNRSLLGFCGIAPIRTTYIGLVEAKNFKSHTWLSTMRLLGKRAG
jgi:putative NADPH-quinone reductase